MQYKTGDTIYDIILSVDRNNNPVTGTTFDIDVYKDGSITTGITVNINLEDDQRGTYVGSWSASTQGEYQLVYKNNSTDVIYVTDIYQVRDNLGNQIYVGL